jgi:hypothetical protein
MYAYNKTSRKKIIKLKIKNKKKSKGWKVKK